MRQLLISVLLEFVDHHGQHVGHCVVHTLDPSIGIWVVGAGEHFPNPNKFVDGKRKLWEKLEAVVRGHAAWASPEGHIPVDENVSRALSCELCSHCEHVG